MTRDRDPGVPAELRVEPARTAAAHRAPEACPTRAARPAGDPNRMYRPSRPFLPCGAIPPGATVGSIQAVSLFPGAAGVPPSNRRRSQRDARRRGALASGCLDGGDFGIIAGFPDGTEHTMEAERLNAIANRIADLSGRGEQLRRYL